jgi:hypothetical protein
MHSTGQLSLPSQFGALDRPAALKMLAELHENVAKLEAVLRQMRNVFNSTGTGPAAPRMPGGSVNEENHPAQDAASQSRRMLRVAWLTNHRPHERLMATCYVQNLLTRHQFDLMVVETREAPSICPVTRAGQVWITSLSRTNRIFLRLVFTHVGKDLKYDTIATALGFRVSQLGASNRIQQIRHRFDRRVAGSLARRIFGNGHDHRYPIRARGWSMCWIADADGETQSVPLTAGSPPERQ